MYCLFPSVLTIVFEMNHRISFIARQQLLRSLEFELELLCKRTFDSQKARERQQKLSNEW